MKLDHEFIRLPFRFDAERLQAEVTAFAEKEWMPHVQQYPGNTSVPLISLRGEMNDDFNGPMAATEKLNRSPYLQQVIASFGEVFGRSRLMGLAAGCSVPEHRDVNYHWYSRVRIHIPIVTDERVLFYCGDKHVHMAAGETWIFDSWKRHRVANESDKFRVHLVIDTSGSPKFWQSVAASEWRTSRGCIKKATVPDRTVAYQSDTDVAIQTEQFNAPLVMGPGEVDALVLDIIADMRAHPGNQPQPANRFEAALQEFRHEWRRIWSVHGPVPSAFAHYQQLLEAMPNRMPRLPLKLKSNDGSAVHTFGQRVMAASLNVALAGQYQH